MRTKLIAITLLVGGLALGAMIIGGCTTNSSSATTRSASLAAEKSGAQLWTDNCMRCHNLRGPETYSATQWEVAVHHMRLRANLTGQETRKVTDFLKSAS
jgi:cytochrome c553